MMPTPAFCGSSVFCLIVISLIHKGDAVPCNASNMHYIPNTCYGFSESFVPWHEANETCQLIGGMTLSSFRDGEDILHLHQISSDIFRPPGYWVAAVGSIRVDVYLWQGTGTDAVVTEKVWYPGKISTGDRCVTADFTQDKLFSHLCLEKFRALCSFEGCSSDCGGDGACDTESNHCLSGCRTNRSGLLCNEECPANCRQIEPCHQITRVCQGCIDGFHGDNCTLPCPKCTNNTLECHQQDGKCFTGCKLGYSGYDCNEECSAHCNLSACERFTKKCIKGCKPGFTGAHCNHSCFHCAGDGSCTQTDKVCLHKCQEGFVGNTCELKAESAYDVTLIYTVVFLTMIALVVVTSAVIIRNKLYNHINSNESL